MWFHDGWKAALSEIQTQTMNKNHSIFLATAALLLPASICHAALVTDTFSDGDRTTNAAWYYAVGSGAPTSVNTNGTQQNLYVNASSRSNAQVWTTFSSTTIAVGQTLRVSMNFDVSGGSGNSGDAPLRVGFYNVASPVAADQDGGITNANWSEATGYAAFVSAAAGSTLTGSTTNFRQRTDANNTLWAGGAHTGITSNVSGTVPAVLGGDADLTTSPLRYTLGYTMTRTGADSMDLFYSLSDANGQIHSISGSAASGIESTFNTFSFFTGAAAAEDFAIDNVTVELVPEPGVALLGAAAGMLLLQLRKR